MYGLTITGPWATFIAHELKRNETRDWPCWERVIGQRIAIHQGAGFGHMGTKKQWAEKVLVNPALCRAMVQAGYLLDTLPLGAIVATARVTACQRITRAQRDSRVLTALETPNVGIGWEFVGTDEEALGNYAPGRWAWVLSDVQRLAVPVPCRGSQGLWHVSADIVEQIRAASVEVAA